MNLTLDKIPSVLTERPQWVLWRGAKVPYQVNGAEAKSNDPATWNTFEAVEAAYDAGGWDGVGYEFAADDPFCGVDLDGCRGTDGKLTDWAREIVEAFATYAEISPSGTGVKLIVLGKSPFPTGKKTKVDSPPVCDKPPGIEIYDHARYFAMTGWRLRGPTDPQPRQEQLDWLKTAYWPAPPPTRPPLDFRGNDAVLGRARKYVATMPPAVSGQGGHNQTFHVACVLVLGFGLGVDAAMNILREYNERCQPEWSDRELWHKAKSADQQPGERNYLRNIQPEKWATVTVPNYGPIAPRVGPSIERLDAAAQRYANKILESGEQLISLGIGKLDYAIGGGVETGELILVCARPSMGKSMVALQMVHGWTGIEIPCAFASQEMSALALGKRSLQFITSVPQEHWRTSMDEVVGDLEHYRANHAPAFVIGQCEDTDEVVSQIEGLVKEHQVRCAVVDYAQLLRAPGKSSVERVAYTSMAMRNLATKHNIVLVLLCQMSRSIEARKKYIPVMSDIGESGQLERDADVILFPIWLHKLNVKNPPEQYQIWVCKNRNRPIREGMVECKFFPSRQMLLEPTVQDRPNYSPDIAAYNDSRKDCF